MRLTAGKLSDAYPVANEACPGVLLRLGNTVTGFALGDSGRWILELDRKGVVRSRRE